MPASNCRRVKTTLEVRAQARQPDGGEPLWDRLPTEQRDGVIALIRDTLDAMKEHAEEWIPTEVRVLDEGFALAITWDLANVEPELLGERARSQIEITQALAELREGW